MQNQNNNNNEEDISMYYPDGDAEHMEIDDAFLNENLKKKKRIRKKRARLTKSQIAMIVIIFVIYTAVIFAAAWLIFYKPAQPGNNEIPFETDPAYSENDSPENGNDDPDKSGNQSGVVSDGYTVKDGVYNILVVGHDDAAHLADVTMIVNCNVNDNTISVMQIPRDTLITTGNLQTNKANEAFSALYVSAYKADSDEPYKKAMADYAAMYEKSLCIKIHHTICMNLAGFRGIVNALDGVDVYVPEDMNYNDPEQDLYISIPKGYQHLDGDEAEGFIRFRSGYLQADLGRVNAQKIFLTAMFNKVKATIKAADVSTISALASEVFEHVTTDLSVSDIIYYAKFLMGVDLESINMTTMPGNTAGAYYVMNRAAALEVINKYFNIYTKEITDSIFDRNYLFCYTEQKYLADVYFSDAANVFDDVHNAGDIDEDSIYIPQT